MATITQAKPDEREDIKAFYHQCSYGGGLGEKDLIWIARFEAKIIGAVRLCPEAGFFVLRGMQVLAPFQRQGIGRQLLQSCIDHLDNRLCYCIPWQHLRTFYQQAGFQEISPIQAPVLLQDRLKDYIFREMRVILMGRIPASQQHREANN